MDRGGLESLAARGQRARLTCTACYRRKIKCDKKTPCGTCIKRGIAGSCCREENDLFRPATTPTRSAQDEVLPGNEVIQTLLQRIEHLEASLGHDHQGSPQQGEATQDRARQIASPVNDLTEDEMADVSSAVEEGPEDYDAATVLEFLAWGRKKDSDFASAPEHESGPRRLDLSQEDGGSMTDFLAESTKSVQLDVLEALLPSRAHIKQLVDYHDASLLWYHGSYSSTIFSNDLSVFFAEYGGNVRHEQLNLQWLALLFAILTGSMTCASSSTSRGWGFSDLEKPTLSLRWYDATIACLNLAKYTEVHTIYSVQAIATLTISAHFLGNSNSQSVLLASAGRIAQSLGLHRLGSEPATTAPDVLRKCESGKRVFIQLCTQDWFSIPFSETYALNPRFFNTVKPLNCNEDMAVRPQTTPTDASYCNYRYDIAALMPQLLDAMTDCNTLYTKYEQVLKFDDKMRKLATASMPTFLSNNAPVSAEWPIYVNWARRSLTICASHKIIMIHRKFVGLSFTNTAFSFTRRTCLAASKTILREAFAASDENGPVLWIDQAFSVAAGIILSLDTFHRRPEDKEFEEHKQLVSDTIEYLKGFEHSKIAVRGVQLLSFLQQELERSGPIIPRKRPRESHGSTSPSKRRRFNVSSFIRDVSQNLGVSSPNTISTSELASDTAENFWDAFMDLIPSQTGFDGQYLFDTFLGCEGLGQV